MHRSSTTVDTGSQLTLGLVWDAVPEEAAPDGAEHQPTGNHLATPPPGVLFLSADGSPLYILPSVEHPTQTEDLVQCVYCPACKGSVAVKGEGFCWLPPDTHLLHCGTDVEYREYRDNRWECVQRRARASDISGYSEARARLKGYSLARPGIRHGPREWP
jgi:hypothetical protein